MNIPRTRVLRHRSDRLSSCKGFETFIVYHSSAMNTMLLGTYRIMDQRDSGVHEWVHTLIEADNETDARDALLLQALRTFK